MDRDGLKLLARQAVQLNLNYYGAILDLTKDYLQTLAKVAASADLGAQPKAKAPRAAPAGVPATPPLVLAARAGETAEAAVMVVNNLAREVTAEVVLSPALAAAGVEADPPRLALAPGEEATVRLRATLAPEVAEDLRGTVSVPGLASREMPVVLRRLPDAGAVEGTP